MKQNISKYLFSIFFSIYFLLVGMGYNVINYCCDSCEYLGIEAVVNESCLTVHEHTHLNQDKHNVDFTCSNLNHHSDICHLYRLNIDTPILHSGNIHTVNTIILLHLFSSETEIFNFNPEIFNQDKIPPPQNYFLSSGREIISFNSVLII